jgi:hypothetical protein
MGTAKAKRAPSPEEVAHSQTHPLTFGPLGWRAVMGLLWMLVRRKRPIILVGVRTKAHGEWRGRTRRVWTEITASSMQVRDEKALAKELAAELAEKRAEETTT